MVLMMMVVMVEVMMLMMMVVMVLMMLLMLMMMLVGDGATDLVGVWVLPGRASRRLRGIVVCHQRRRWLRPIQLDEV